MSLFAVAIPAALSRPFHRYNNSFRSVAVANGNTVSPSFRRFTSISSAPEVHRFAARPCSPVSPNPRRMYARLACPYVGWSLRLDTIQLSDGRHTLKAVVNSGSFGAGAASVPITISNWISPDPMHLLSIPRDRGRGPQRRGQSKRLGGQRRPRASSRLPCRLTARFWEMPAMEIAATMFARSIRTASGVRTWAGTLPMDTARLSNGSHTVSVTATSGFGEQSTQTATVTVKN